jgi:hypothetical protein
MNGCFDADAYSQNIEIVGGSALPKISSEEVQRFLVRRA